MKPRYARMWVPSLAMLVIAAGIVTTPASTAAALPANEMTFYTPKLRLVASKHGVNWYASCPKGTTVKRAPGVLSSPGSPQFQAAHYETRTGGLYAQGEQGVIETERGNSGREVIKWVFNNPSISAEVVRMSYTCEGIPSEPVKPRYPDIEFDCTYNAGKCEAPDIDWSKTEWRDIGRFGPESYGCADGEDHPGVIWETSSSFTYSTSESIGVDLSLSGSIGNKDQTLGAEAAIGFSYTQATGKSWEAGKSRSQSYEKYTQPYRKGHFYGKEKVYKPVGKLKVTYPDGVNVYTDKPGENTNSDRHEFEVPIEGRVPVTDEQGYIVLSISYEAPRMTAREERDHCPETGIKLQDTLENGATYRINSKPNLLAMDVFGAQVSDDVQVLAWPENGQKNQQWQLITAGIEKQTKKPLWRLVSVNSGKCLTLDRGGDGVQMECLSTEANGKIDPQTFRLEKEGSGWWSIRKANSPGVAFMPDCETGPGDTYVIKRGLKMLTDNRFPAECRMWGFRLEYPPLSVGDA